VLDLANPIRHEHGLAVSLQYFGLVLPGVRMGGLFANLAAPKTPTRQGTLTLTSGAPGPTYGLAPTTRPGGWGELRLENTNTTYANVPDYPGLRLGPEFTVSFWLLVNVVNVTGCLLSKFSNGAGSSGNDLRGIRMQSGTLYCTEQSTNPVSCTPGTLQWLCVTLVNTSAGSTLYANRAVQSTGAAFTQWFNNAGPLRVGGAEAGFFGSSNSGIDGRVDAILMWSRALPTAEVRDVVTLGSQQFQGLLRRARPRFYSLVTLTVGKRLTPALDLTYGVGSGLLGRYRSQPGLNSGALWLNEVRLQSTTVLTPTGPLKPAPHGVLMGMGPPSGVRGWGGTRRRGGAGELRFDGAPYVQLGNSLINLSSAWSFTAWVRLDDIASTTYCILGASYGDTSHTYFMFLHRADKGGLTLQYTNTGASAQYPATATRDMVANTLTHVALVVIPPSTVDIYMDAQRVIHDTAFPSSIIPNQPTGQDWILGSWAASPAANFLKGALDECWLWARPLTPTDVLSVMQLTSQPLPRLGRMLVPCVSSTGGGSSGLRVPPGLWMAGRAA
jgi:hypothetical protein